MCSYELIIEWNTKEQLISSAINEYLKKLILTQWKKLLNYKISVISCIAQIYWLERLNY